MALDRILFAVHSRNKVQMMRAYALPPLVVLALSGCMATSPKSVEPNAEAPVRLFDFGAAPLDHFDGADFRVRILNQSGKVIKYVHLDVFAQNAVGDLATDRLGRPAQRKLQVVGPIEHGEQADKPWPTQFKAVWYNSSIVCAGINGVQITYMDGTTQRFEGGALMPLVGGRGCSVKN